MGNWYQKFGSGVRSGGGFGGGSGVRSGGGFGVRSGGGELVFVKNTLE